MTKTILLLLNKVLTSNASSQHLLAKYYNKSFRIIFPVFSISAVVEKNGSLGLYEQNEVDSTIKIPLSSLNYLINQDKLAIIKQIEINGDKNFGLFLLELLSKLNWNIIDHDKIPGSKILVNFFIKLNEQLQLVATNAAHSITEYLLYETEDLVTQYEMNDFCREVDELNNRADILKARINLLLNA